LPLNFDYNIVKNIVEKISVNTINQNYMYLQWTAVWDALILAADSFWDNDREKVIILLTDWEANKWIDPLVAMNYIKNINNWWIKIYTIWIGWDESTFVRVKNNLWWFQDLPIAWVDEKTLKIIASKTNWEYFRANNKERFENIFDTISKLEKKDIQIDNIIINKEKYTYFLFGLILFFILFLLLKYKKRI
jgi:Ca-activated chloride channel family protein